MTLDARALVDTGFLVALLHRDDAAHAWAARLAPQVPGPWLTCEACVTEASHLLGKAASGGARNLFRILEERLLVSRHLLPEQLAAVCRELDRYRGREMNFADACLLVLSEAEPRLPLVTLDASDFAVYLRGRTPRRLLTPRSS